MSTTASYVADHLPKCLASIVLDYFGRATDLQTAAELGQYEDCMNHPWRYKDEMLRGACRGGHPAIAAMAIERGADNLGSGLAEACCDGHRPMVEFMIACGARSFDCGLACACRHGHLEIARLMITYGGGDWNWGLSCACWPGHQELIDLMLDHGATRCGVSCHKTMLEHRA